DDILEGHSDAMGCLTSGLFLQMLFKKFDGIFRGPVLYSGNLSNQIPFTTDDVAFGQAKRSKLFCYFLVLVPHHFNVWAIDLKRLQKRTDIFGLVVSRDGY